MKIITKRHAEKIAKVLSNDLKNVLIKHGLKPKQAVILSFELNVYKVLTK